MNGKRILKRILESSIIGKRPIGKPRKRWENAVETDSGEVIEVRIWKRKYIGRQVCRRHLKEASARLLAAAP
jgi:hypothetical protein